MDQAHKDALRRIYQADRQLHAAGRDAVSFQLLNLGRMERAIDHPRWDRSWAVPTEHVIDDLDELDLLRVAPHHNKARTFALTVKGRAQGQALNEAVTFPQTMGGRAPTAEVVLRWLVQTADDAPEAFEDPAHMLDRGVSDGVIQPDGRDALAKRILALIDEGYMTADLVEVDQISAEQGLRYARNLALTMKAYDSVRSEASPAATVNIYGSVVNSQIAGGNITNDTTFTSILVQASLEIDALDGVDDETKKQAKGIVSALLGKGANAGGQILTGAAGALVAAVISKLIGVPVG